METAVIKIMIWAICSCKSYNFFIFFFVIILIYRDFMSQVLKIMLTVHCVSIRSIKSKESFRICLIKERVGSIITCKICETTLV